MIGFNGGLIGQTRATNATSSVPGIWTPNEQRNALSDNQWPLQTPYFRYVKWQITAVRQSGSSFQASEFNVRIGTDNVSMSGTTVTNPGGSNPNGEGPDNLVDGSTGSKCLDFNMANSPFTTTLIFDMGSQKFFDGYRWATANDSPERDPVSWTVSASNDNVTYTTYDTITNYATPTSRFTYVGPFTFPGY